MQGYYPTGSRFAIRRSDQIRRPFYFVKASRQSTLDENDAHPVKRKRPAETEHRGPLSRTTCQRSTEDVPAGVFVTTNTAGPVQKAHCVSRDRNAVEKNGRTHRCSLIFRCVFAPDSTGLIDSASAGADAGRSQTDLLRLPNAGPLPKPGVSAA